MAGDGGAGTQGHQPTGRLRRSPLLDREDLIRLAVVATPLVGVDLGLDLVRALGQPAGSRAPGLEAMPGNALVHLGVLGLWVLAFTAIPRGRPRRVRDVAFHLSAAGYLVLTVAADLYQRRTGSQLDLATLTTATHAPGVAGDLVRRAAGPGPLVALLLVLAWSVLAPWCVRRVARVLADHRSTSRRPTAGRGRPHLLVAGAAALALVVGATVPLAAGTGAYGRHLGVELAVEAWQQARGEAQASRTVPGPEREPSTLVRTAPQARGAKPSNLVVVVLESLRWSATSLGDPELGTTPFLAELAERSTVATRAYTAVPHTSKALTSIHCGITPPLDQRLTESEPGRIPATCLPELLGQQGYTSAFFQSATGGFERRPDLVRNLGFGAFRGVEDLPTEGFGAANYFGVEDDVLLEPAARWMAAQQRPFALTLLTVGGHHDYVLPDTFALQHLSDDEELNRYLNAAVYVDRFVEQLFGELDDLGLADDTVVALVGDHGEGFGEHGLRQHDNTIYDEGVHVPLLVHDPADPRGRTVDVPVTTATTLPTVLDALGYGVVGGAPVPPPLRDARPEPVHLSCQSTNRCLSRIDSSTKYVHHFGHRPDEVFDLDADPLERDNRAHTLSRAELSALREDVLGWRAAVRLAWAPTG